MSHGEANSVPHPSIHVSHAIEIVVANWSTRHQLQTQSPLGIAVARFFVNHACIQSSAMLWYQLNDRLTVTSKRGTSELHKIIRHESRHVSHGI